MSVVPVTRRRTGRSSTTRTSGVSRLIAASIAGLLLTTAAMITDKPKPKSKAAPAMEGMGGMGGGMDF